jgi:hypothetical protein
MTLYKKFIAGIIELGLTEEEIKKWQYCGGDYASHRHYFELRFPKRKFPDHVQRCVCGHDIKRNAYICNEIGDYNSIIPIGSCCIKHFMTNGLRRTCETCGVIHQNRLINKCNDCRTLCCGFKVKQDGKCFQCKKKEDIEKNHESCFQCGTLKRIGVECLECRRIETLRRLNEPKKCECGKQIESKYDRCWTCYNAKKATCIECHKKFDNKDKFTRCFDCASSSKKAFVPKYKNNVIRKDCHECNDTLVSYWSDDVYGPCMQCCCINCEKKVCDCID